MTFHPKICVIGGGAAGLCIGKWLKQADFSFDLFEREKDFGGNWAAHLSSGKVYETTRLISSKANTQFSDFPMPESYPVYPSHIQMYQYLLAYAKNFDLYSHSTLNTEVKSLYPKEHQWMVQLSTGKEMLYDCIIVANGALHEPRIPSYHGRFSGEIYHSVRYKTAKSFDSKRVLVVGGGNSGCDIAVDLSRIASKTTLSLRRGYYFMPKFVNGIATQDWLMQQIKNFNSSDEYWEYVKNTFKLCSCDGTDFGLPAPDYQINQAHPTINSHILHAIAHQSVYVKPDIEFLDGKQVYFTDGTVEEFDAIIYATGYKKSVPFLQPSFWEGNSIESNLYLQIFHKKYPSLLFFGYISAPSGIGNMANIAASMLISYLKAWTHQTKAFQTFRKFIHLPEPDLGQSLFYPSERHTYEVELWKFLTFIKQLKEKLEVGQA